MKISSSVKISAVSLVIGAVIGACAAGANQPNMQAARAELIQARPNKGGHRDRAISLVNAAINETEAGIGYAGD
jgi:hypothetical protein